MKGLGALNNHPQKFGTQVPDVTKPLADATEAVDGGRTIILHRTGGIVKKLSHESVEKIQDIIKAEEGPKIILERRGGAFTFDIDVKSGESSNQQWQTPKKTVKAQSNRGNHMEIDMADKNMFDPLSDDESETLQCGTCHPGERFHWP